VALRLRGGVVPAGGGVVVVRARVDHALARVVVRQVGVVGVAREGELQHLHAGEAVAGAQLVHVGRDDAQILGYQRQLGELAPERVEQVVAGSGHPPAVHGGGLGGGDLPVGREAA